MKNMQKNSNQMMHIYIYLLLPNRKKIKMEILFIRMKPKFY